MLVGPVWSPVLINDENELALLSAQPASVEYKLDFDDPSAANASPKMHDNLPPNVSFGHRRAAFTSPVKPCIPGGQRMYMLVRYLKITSNFILEYKYKIHEYYTIALWVLPLLLLVSPAH